MQDESLLAGQAARGERDAFARLTGQYQKPVYNLILRMVGDREDAADLTQDTFLKAWRSIAFFRGECSFSTWIYQIASNLCIDHLRHRKRITAVSTVFLDGDGEEQICDLPDPGPRPEDLVLGREQMREIGAAMNALEVEYRQILTLRVINGLSYTQIGEILDLPEGTVRSRLSRARGRLKQMLVSGNFSTPDPSEKRKGVEPDGLHRI